MRGRAAFTTGEIQRIELVLGQLSRTPGERRRELLAQLRRSLRFYVSDFARAGRRLTPDDFERLLAQGVIRIH